MNDWMDEWINKWKELKEARETIVMAPWSPQILQCSDRLCEIWVFEF